MKRSDLPQAFQEALGTHEVLRKLGFLAKEIFVHQNPDNSVLVLLRTQGKEFIVHVGFVGMTRDEMEKEWPKAVRAFNNLEIPEQELLDMVSESKAFREKVSLIFAIQDKGIVIPNRSGS